MPHPSKSLPQSMSSLAWGILVLIFVVFLAACSMVDGYAYTQVPVLWALFGGLVLFLFLMMRGLTLPRPTPLMFFSLLAAVFFYFRASLSYDVLDGLSVMGIVLACLVFYGAGILCGLSSRGGALFAKLVGLSVLLSMAYWGLAHFTNASMLWWGRAPVGLAGPNTPHEALFCYKNVACAFFVSAGAFLMARVLWLRVFSWGSVLSFLLGLCAVILSFFCASRVVYMILPVALILTWLLNLYLRVLDGRRFRLWDALIACACLAGVSLVIWDIVGSQRIMHWILDVDTHLRFMIWQQVCHILPQAPLYGYGVDAAQWEIVPFWTEWASPSFAHNEYLQLWADFGIVGLGLALVILLWHLLQGFVYLSEERLPLGQRVMVAGSAFILLLLSLYAAVDFPWHQMGFACLCAFLCGMLAAPLARGRGVSSLLTSDAGGQVSLDTRLKPMGLGARLVCVFLCCALMAGLSHLAYRLGPAWRAQWSYHSLRAQGAEAEAEAVFLQSAVSLFPETDILNWSLHLPRTQTQQQQRALVQMLDMCIEYNPKQLFAVVMQADALRRLGEYEAADLLLRKHYSGDGYDNKTITSWATYYGENLLEWSHALFLQGEFEKSMSVGLYALRMHQKSALRYNIAYRSGKNQDWDAIRKSVNQRNKQIADLAQRVSQDIALLNDLGKQPDDSWARPRGVENKPALYQRWANPSLFMGISVKK